MNTESLSGELHNLQDKVIGLFRHYKQSDYDMVVSNDDGYLQTISIGKLGGLHELHIMADQGKLIMFKEGETLTTLMKNPFYLDELIKEILN